jgi:hypothetical protein
MATLVEEYDLKNGILGMDRDLFLCVIQYLNTALLRRYIGFSEESFSRTNHLHYHIYREKFNNTPLRKLIIPNPPEEIQIIDRTIRFGSGRQTITLKDKILNNIFELKLRYFKEIKIQQNSVLNNEICKKGAGVEMDRNILRFRFDKYGDSCSSSFTINSKYLTKKNELLTIILNMKQGCDTLYMRINNHMIPNAFCNIPHRRRMISIEGNHFNIVTLVSANYLQTLPIDPHLKYTYWNSFDGEKFDNIIHKKRKILTYAEKEELWKMNQK